MKWFWYALGLSVLVDQSEPTAPAIGADHPPADPHIPRVKCPHCRAVIPYTASPCPVCKRSTSEGRNIHSGTGF